MSLEEVLKGELYDWVLNLNRESFGRLFGCFVTFHSRILATEVHFVVFQVNNMPEPPDSDDKS